MKTKCKRLICPQKATAQNSSVDELTKHLIDCQVLSCCKEPGRQICITFGVEFILRGHNVWAYYGVDYSNEHERHVCKVVIRDKKREERDICKKAIIGKEVLDILPRPITVHTPEPNYYQYCVLENAEQAKDKLIDVLTLLKKYK